MERNLTKLPLMYMVINTIKKNNELSITQISYQTKGTFSYVHTIIKYLNANGFINTKESGRSVLISLTPKGEDLATAVQFILDLISNNEVQQNVHNEGI